MHIETGLFNHMVLQRTRTNRSHAKFTGTASTSGDITARVRSGGKTLAGWANKRVGASAHGKIAGSIDGLKVGGPYDIELRISGSEEVLAVNDVLVGDVWLLGGQSNMQGVGYLCDALRGKEQVRAFYPDDTWEVAVDPLHTLWCAVDPVHGGNTVLHRKPQPPERFAGTGPGVAFGQELLARTGVPQGLIACAHGGTTMLQWSHKLKNRKGASLFGAMCRRIQKNGGAVAGMFWYQGESDANANAVVLYTPRMKQFIAALRRECAAPTLPVVVVQLATVARRGDANDHVTRIREQQRLLPRHIKHLAVVPAIDLPLDDVIHLNGPGQHTLGRRAAQAMQVLRGDRTAGKPPIDVRDVSVIEDPISKLANVVVRFSNVQGKLQAPGRPSGFSLDKSLADNFPYRIDLEKDTAIIRSGVQIEMMAEQLYYGLGTSPYCNLTDSAGRSVPAFGPLPLINERPRARTAFVTNTRISDILGSVDIAKLECGQAPALKPQQFPGIFCDRHLELAAAGPALVYYAFAFRCSEPMKLQLLLGYDGPVKVWLDGQELFCDPAGTNPARPEDAVLPLSGTPGDHEILVALGSGGAAWGVFLRLERLDVSKALLRKNPQAVKLPEILG